MYFSSVYRVWISKDQWVNFKACFSSVYRVWISDVRWGILKVCFSSVYRVWISEDWWVNSKACFSSVYRVWISDGRWRNFKVCFQYFTLPHLFCRGLQDSGGLHICDFCHILDSSRLLQNRWGSVKYWKHTLKFLHLPSEIHTLWTDEKHALKFTHWSLEIHTL